MASSYLTGAKISVRLREEGQISQIEAERLVAFTNASSPLFIFAAISVGFFHDVKLGLLLGASHYIGTILVGICMRFHGQKQEPANSNKNNKYISVGQAWKEMHQSRIRDRRPVG